MILLVHSLDILGCHLGDALVRGDVRDVGTLGAHWIARGAARALRQRDQLLPVYVAVLREQKRARKEATKARKS